MDLNLSVRISIQSRRLETSPLPASEQQNQPHPRPGKRTHGTRDSPAPTCHVSHFASRLLGCMRAFGCTFVVCESVQVSMALALIALVAWLVWMDPTDRQITTFITVHENVVQPPRTISS